MSKQKIREQYLLDIIGEYEKFTGMIGVHLKDKLWGTCIVDWLLVNRAIDRIERNKDQYTQDQSGWISVDKVRLNVDLVLPVARYEGPDYYKGYHQAREDILATLPPIEEV